MKNNSFHPLKTFKSQGVYDLLIEFYSANFQKAGVESTIAKELVENIWKNKDLKEENVLITETKDFFKKANKQTDYRSEEKPILDFIDLSQVKTFLDVGSNELNLINRLSKNQKNIEKFIGLDIIAQKNSFCTPEKCQYFQIDSEIKKFSVKEKVDLINLRFTLHHFPSLESIQRLLENCKNILNSDGKIILWEETFSEKLDIEKTTEENNKLGIFTDNTLTEKFYKLNKEKRWEFIIVNDWIVNVSNLHMPWNNQYRIWEDWIKLFSQYGFGLKKEYNLGLRVNGKIKQGVQIIGIFLTKTV